MKSIITILFFLLGFYFSYSQSDGFDISKWNSYPIPTNKDTLLKYNWSNVRWYLHKKGRKVYAKSSEDFRRERKLPFELRTMTKKEEWEMRGEIAYTEVDSGYLVSFYQGEFGGSLYWFDKAGKNAKKIGYAMIMDFITRDHKIYALDGLGHMGMSYGSIIEVRKENNEWKLFNYVKLLEAPRAITLDDQNKFIVATYDKILSVDRDKRIDTLLQRNSWNLLNPSSVVVVGNYIYVGMQEGVYKFDIGKRREEWLMKD